MADLGAPRSTVQGWLRGEHRPVISAEVLDLEAVRLQAEVLKLRRHVRMLGAIVRLLMALFRALDFRLEQIRLPDGAAKIRLLRAIERAQGALSLRATLRILGLSPSRCHRWRRADRLCELGGQSGCPRSTPTRLTAAEILGIKDMVESPWYRHVPTGRLAILAKRFGRVFALRDVRFSDSMIGAWWRTLKHQ